MKAVTLPSGAILKIQVSPFAVSKALYQALLRELKELPINSKVDMASVYKDLFCIGFSSPAIEACLVECFKRCTYDYGKGELKIDDQTFEPVERREDYMTVCMEVAKENCLPFAKSLYAQYAEFMASVENIPT